jgi:acyl-CoA synthetase (AMP-forming)/AMP-acid ligase II
VAVQRNTPLFPLVLLGAARAAMVVVPVNATYGPNDLRHVITDSGARLLICEDDLLDPAAQGLAEAVPELGLLSAAEVTAWVGSGGTPLPADVDDDTLLSLQYTSGTTGSPKACMLTHGYRRHLGRSRRSLYPAGPTTCLTAQAATTRSAVAPRRGAPCGCRTRVLLRFLARRRLIVEYRAPCCTWSA